MCLPFLFLRASCIFWISKSPFRYRIVPSLAKWIATKDSPYRKDCSNDKAAFSICFNSIGRAGWSKPAAGPFQRRYEFSVEAYEPNHYVFHFFTSVFLSKILSSRALGKISSLDLPDCIYFRLLSTKCQPSCCFTQFPARRRKQDGFRNSLPLPKMQLHQRCAAPYRRYRCGE